jgi:hypothetical protein
MDPAGGFERAEGGIQPEKRFSDARPGVDKERVVAGAVELNLDHPAVGSPEESRAAHCNIEKRPRVPRPGRGADEGGMRDKCEFRSRPQYQRKRSHNGGEQGGEQDGERDNPSTGLHVA